MKARRLNVECLESRLPLASHSVVITEFMASNATTLSDSEGGSPDWIEIHNSGNQPIDLSGFRLTDDAEKPSRWTFPSALIEPAEYLVVFASGKQGSPQVDGHGELHTSFSLKSSGEYLALISSAGGVVSEFGTRDAYYPPQRTDVSYGVAQLGSMLISKTGYMASPTPGATNVGPAETFEIMLGARPSMLSRFFTKRPLRSA